MTGKRHSKDCAKVRPPGSYMPRLLMNCKARKQSRIFSSLYIFASIAPYTLMKLFQSRILRGFQNFITQSSPGAVRETSNVGAGANGPRGCHKSFYQKASTTIFFAFNLSPILKKFALSRLSTMKRFGNYRSENFSISITMKFQARIV